MSEVKNGETKMTKLDAVKAAIKSGITSPQDIEKYCDGLGMTVKRGYIFSIKWQLKQSAKNGESGRKNGKKLNHAGSSEIQAMEFALRSGGIKHAIEQLDGLQKQPSYKFSEKFHGVDKAKRLLESLSKKLMS